MIARRTICSTGVMCGSIKRPIEPFHLFSQSKNLVYYFAVRFPGKTGFIYQSLRGWIIVCAIMVVILLIYLYALYIILQQQRYARAAKRISSTT